MTSAAIPPGVAAAYADWLAELKVRIRAAQQRAALMVNTGLLQLATGC